MLERIFFEKAQLAGGSEFDSKGSDLETAEKAELHRIVDSFEPEDGCSVTTTVEGFASDEEFKGLCAGSDNSSQPSERLCRESTEKNLRVADHRAAAVYKELWYLREQGNKWLNPVEPARWMPAINKEANVDAAWTKMTDRRNKTVRPSGSAVASRTDGSRDPRSDRVVVLEWKINGPCKGPPPDKRSETEPKENR